ncbi:hypothetical protein [Caulobacter sp. BK020]|uniref:hypothetical protein n=1 Tax=Caulobacter sp. BK020 TaxID=2512117 RepID=UPI0010468D2C|nr:hypothetical protein [Caulobacter sp. BK020]TCS12225.1 hypothetical protein EV278_1144 [Caulobacter sp. BK020]
MVEDGGPPLVVKASRAVNWVRLGVTTAMALVVSLVGFANGPGPFLLTTIFAAVCLISALWPFTDREPRLIVEDHGLRWRDWPSRQLSFTAWSRFTAARIIEPRDRMDLFWLRLELTEERDRRYVQVKLEGTDVDEDDLKLAIHRRAPHLFPELAKDGR